MKKRKLDFRLNDTFYWFIRGVTQLVCDAKFKIKVLHPERIPAEGPVILASNHASNYDPFLVAYSFRYRLYYMGKEELFQKPVSSFIMKGLKTFPVRRGSVEPATIKHSLSLLKDNCALGIFPEGSRSLDGEIREGQEGAAMISLLSGAPVLPLAIGGTAGIDIEEKEKKLKGKRPAYILYGDLIYPNQFEGAKKERKEQMTRKITESIRELKKELENVWEQ